MKRAVIILFSLMICAVAVFVNGSVSVKADTSASPKNVIIMIGDGMGPNQINMAHDKNGSNLTMENMPYKGTSATNNSADDTTDSAAGSTAIACGVKVRNGYVGMNASKTVLPNIREFMAERGRKTGIITTDDITGATPACFGAHTSDRSNKSSISKQYIENDIDLLFGGGSDSFDADVLKNAQIKSDYCFIEKRSEMLLYNSGKVLGLFSKGSFPYYSSNPSVPSLAEMTTKAIEVLNKNQKGFFLMVEGGKIDHAGHANLLDKALSETLEFDKAVKVACDFAASDKNTLVVVTADHETGGLQKNGSSYSYTTTTHTSVDVPVFATGVGASSFTGAMVNTDINKKIKKLVDKDYVEKSVETTSSQIGGFLEIIDNVTQQDKEANASKSTTSENNDKTSSVAKETSKITSSADSSQSSFEMVNADDETEISDKNDNGYLTIIIIAVCVFVVLFAIEIFVIIKFKKKR